MTSKQLGTSLLASVSRSFYLTLRVLPRPLREPLSVAYLLARATDTIADSSTTDTETRLRFLRALRDLIFLFAKNDAQNSSANRDLAISEREKNLPKLQRAIVSEDIGEQRLIAELPACLDWFASLAAEDREEITAVLREIAHGQELDLQRFVNRDRVAALQSAAELDEYTFLVAGCVGKFWTRLGFRHVKNYARLDAAEMELLGIRFGKGLQLVNILRDLPRDLQNGRCYLPADELSCAPETLAANHHLAQPVFAQWLETANHHLDAAQHYIESLRPWRLRYACILPWALGVQTLALLEKRSPLATGERIKVPRAEVYRLMRRAIPATFSNAQLRKLRLRS